MRFFTADLHLGHSKIIEYSGRPFREVDEMNETLVDRWNAVVGANDEVVVLGDVALGRLAETLPLVARLNGRKVLVPGNHDRCWPEHRDADKEARRYLEAGFMEVWPPLVELQLAGTPVLACHFPYGGAEDDPGERFPDHGPSDDGALAAARPRPSALAGERPNGQRGRGCLGLCTRQ